MASWREWDDIEEAEHKAAREALSLTGLSDETEGPNDLHYRFRWWCPLCQEAKTEKFCSIHGDQGLIRGDE